MSVESINICTRNVTPLDWVRNWVHENPTTIKVLKIAALIIGIGLLISLPFIPLALEVKITIAVSVAVTLLAVALYHLFNSCVTKENPISHRLRSLNDSNCKGEICGVYITSNENGLAETRQALMQIPCVPNSCHIGFSGWYNFDIMAMRESTYGLICDFNPANKVFIEKTLKILKGSLTREDFVKEMSGFLRERAKKSVNTCEFVNQMRFSPNLELNYKYSSDETSEEFEVRNELTREGSWLASDRAFHYVKTLALEDRVAAITTDILNTKKFQEIAKIYQENGVKIDSLYLSNICNYINGTDKSAAYTSTVHALMQPKTIVINCPLQDTGDDIEFEYPTQTVYLGETFKTSEDDKRLFTI